MRWQRPGVGFFLCALLAACGVPAVERPTDPAGQAVPRGQPRTLIMASNTEVHSLAPKIIGPTNPTRTTRLFNAQLALNDGRGEPRPYLTENLPRLNTDSWRVFPDGRMETVYLLRPGLTWHDGTALAAEDFVFAWLVYTAPGLAVFKSTPQELMEEVQAPNPRSIVIRWRATYPGAGAIVVEELDPLPRHILGADFAAYQEAPETREAFLGRRFWSSEYVGAGPFRLTGWEPGSQLEGVAFEGHVLGRPKIDRLVVRFIGDDNTVTTNLLAEHIHYAMQQSLRFEQAAFLHKEWSASGRGVVLYMPTSTSSVAVQMRPEYVQQAGLRDIRVRRALAHALDKQGLVYGLFEGQGRIAHTYIGPEQPFYPEVDRGLMKYAYDPGQAEELMAEAGFRKDRDGLFANEAGERFQPALWVTSGSQTERLLALLTSAWKSHGFDFQPHVIPIAQARDNQTRSTFPGLLNYGVSLNRGSAYETFISAQIGTPANRWGGQNRGGWSNPQFDRLVDALNSALDPGDRVRHLADAARILSEELPNFPLCANLGAITHLAMLKGPETGTPETLVAWNIHEWELR